MFKYKTEAELTAMTAEQRDVYAEQKRAWEATQTKEQIEKALEEFKKANPIPEPQVTKAMYDELQEKFNQLQERATKESKEVDPILAFCTEKFDEVKTAFLKGEKKTFVVKADTLRSSITSNANALDLSGIGQLAYPKLTAYDVFRKVPVNPNQNGTVRYYDWDAATTARAAAAIAEGGNFPSSTAKWQTYTTSLQKIGDSIPVSEEFFYDAQQFAAELDNFLRVNVMIIINDKLITGNGVAPEINGAKNQIPTYTPVGAGIETPTIYDLIVKMKEAITKPYGSKYSPNVAMMNITDINRYKLAKDANENYLMPPFVTRDGQTIDGVLVIECNDVDANTMLLGDNRYGAIYEEPGFAVEVGFATGDFESDMKTLKARKRLQLLIRTVDRTGWLECTDITAALAILDNPAS